MEKCVCGLCISPTPLCVYNGRMYTVVYVACSLLCFISFSGLIHATVSWHLCLCVLCLFSKGTRSMTPAAIHYLWCLVYNIFALSRGPACNWHINQQINTCTRRSLDGLHSACPSGSAYLLYTHFCFSRNTLAFTEQILGLKDIFPNEWTFQAGCQMISVISGC